jgi:hypothetical protein
LLKGQAPAKLIYKKEQILLEVLFNLFLAGQKIPDHKPPKILMDKQIKHLGSSSPF